MNKSIKEQIECLISEYNRVGIYLEKKNGNPSISFDRTILTKANDECVEKEESYCKRI